MNGTILGLSLNIWGLICLAVAAVYMFVWPRPRPGETRGPALSLLLRYGHSLVWVLLAAAAFIWSGLLPVGNGLAQSLALAALLVYMAFLMAMVRARHGPDR